MSFTGQILRNNIPDPSIIKYDDSSNGAILLDTIGKYLESVYYDVKKVMHQNRPLSDMPSSEPGNLYIVDFKNSDDFNQFLNSLNDNFSIENVNAIVLLSNQEIYLTRIFEYLDLCKVLPTRLESKFIENIENVTLYTLTDDYNHRISDRVYLHEDGIKLYFDIVDIDEYELLEERKQNEDHIIVSGHDIYDEKFQEQISINHEGLYSTLNKYTEILPALEEDAIVESGSIEVAGIKGTIKVKKLPINVLLKKHSIIESTVLNNNNQQILVRNDIYFNLTKQNGVSYLDYIHKYFDRENIYKNKYSNIEHEMFENTLFSKVFLDSDNAFPDIQDYCFDYVRDKLLTIDNTGILRWYNYDPTPFVQKEYGKSIYRNFYLSCFTNRAALYETLNIKISPYGNHDNSKKYFIARRTPTSKLTVDENYNFEYLQSDMTTWSSNIHIFDIHSAITENTSYVLNKNFDNYFDEIGQYDFYIYSFRTKQSLSLLADYLNNFFDESKFKKAIQSLLSDTSQKHITIDSYSILVEAFTPVKEMQTNIDKLASESYGLFTRDLENNIYVTVNKDDGSSDLYHVKEYKDYFAYNVSQSAGIFLEQYDSLNVVFNNGAYTETGIQYD